MYGQVIDFKDGIQRMSSIGASDEDVLHRLGRRVGDDEQVVRSGFPACGCAVFMQPCVFFK